MPTTVSPEPPTDSDPANVPLSTMTEEEKRKIADAFANPIYSKNISAIASGLGMSYSRVYKYIRKTPALLSQHPRQDPEALVPSDLSVIDRAPILTRAEIAEMDAMAGQEDKLVRRDWAALGLSDGDGDMLTSLELFARWPLKETIAKTHGCMMFCLTKLMAQFKRNAEALEGGVKIIDHDKDKDGEEYDASLDIQREQVRLTAEIRAIYAQIYRSMLLELKAEAMKRDNEKPKGREKPGFSPQNVTDTTP